MPIKDLAKWMFEKTTMQLMKIPLSVNSFARKFGLIFGQIKIQLNFVETKIRLN